MEDQSAQDPHVEHGRKPNGPTHAHAHNTKEAIEKLVLAFRVAEKKRKQLSDDTKSNNKALKRIKTDILIEMANANKHRIELPDGRTIRAEKVFKV